MAVGIESGAGVTVQLLAPTRAEAHTLACTRHGVTLSVGTQTNRVKIFSVLECLRLHCDDERGRPK